MPRVIKNFEDDLKYGGFDKKYLDPLNSKEDEKLWLGKYRHVSRKVVDKVDGMIDWVNVEVLIYQDVLDEYNKFKVVKKNGIIHNKDTDNSLYKDTCTRS